jgi:hypothetical protein
LDTDASVLFLSVGVSASLFAGHAVGRDIVNEFDVGREHASAAIALEANFGKHLAGIAAILDTIAVAFP